MPELNYRFNGSDYCLHDGDEPIGKLLNEVAIAFDLESGTRHKHGDPVLVNAWHQKVSNEYRQAGLAEIADDLVVITGRFPVDEINKCLDISGYVLRMYRRMLAGEIAPSDPMGSHFTGTPVQVPSMGVQALSQSEDVPPNEDEAVVKSPRIRAFRQPGMRR